MTLFVHQRLQLYFTSAKTCKPFRNDRFVIDAVRNLPLEGSQYRAVCPEDPLSQAVVLVGRRLVGRQQHFMSHLEQRRIRMQGFIFKDIHPGGGEVVASQRLHQRFLVHHLTA